MTKAEAERLSQTIEKYSLALGCCLYPSQVEALHNALEYWRTNKKMPVLEDAFTKLAFLMIISDLMYQERKVNGGE